MVSTFGSRLIFVGGLRASSIRVLTDKNLWQRGTSLYNFYSISLPELTVRLYRCPHCRHDLHVLPACWYQNIQSDWKLGLVLTIRLLDFIWESAKVTQIDVIVHMVAGGWRIPSAMRNCVRTSKKRDSAIQVRLGRIHSTRR